MFFLVKSVNVDTELNCDVSCFIAEYLIAEELHIEVELKTKNLDAAWQRLSSQVLENK
jgi:hypothetical protein